MAQYNIDWNGTSTFVREKVIPKIKDQFFKKNAMMFRLRNRAEILSGGKFIRQPLSFAPEGGGGQWWAGTDKFDTRLRQPFDSATYFFKNFEVPVIISQDEEDEVSGPEAWTSLVEAKMKLANRTIMDSLGGSLGIFNDGSNPKAMTGFQFSLQDAITSQYGGIPQAVLDNPDLVELMLPCLRADFTVFETYRYVDEAPLACPITAFGGARDRRITEHEISEWRRQTTDDFRYEMFDGDHFFLQDKRDQLLASVMRELSAPGVAR